MQKAQKPNFFYDELKLLFMGLMQNQDLFVFG